MDKPLNKSGPWTVEEKEFIAQNCQSMAFEEIARRIQRNPDKVKTYITKTLGQKTIKTQQFQVNPEYDIQRSPIWDQIKEQFSPDERKIFLYHWSRYILQFKDDVFPTEELQIIDSIKLEILLDRALRSQRQSVSEIENYELELQKLKAAGGEDNLHEIRGLEQLILSCRTAMQSLGREYNDLLNRKVQMLKELKATRDQRVTKIESSKQTVLGWIAELIRDKELRRKLGLQMEKMRIAIDVEKLRLMEPHKYMDGVIDYPILNSDTVEKKDKENEEKSINTGSDGPRWELPSGIPVEEGL